jgi:hypothetical protein
MKKIFLLCLFIFPLFALAQTESQNEIGIGIGSIEYVPTGLNSPNSTSLYYYTPFSHSYLIELSINNNPKNDYLEVFPPFGSNYYSVVSPSFYYNRAITNKINAFISYQFISIYGNFNNISTDSFYNFNSSSLQYDHYINSYSFSEVIHKFNVGVTYTLLKKKHFTLYSGLATQISLNILRQNGCFEADLANGNMTKNIIDGNEQHISVQVLPLFGIQIPLYKNFSLTYELAGFITFQNLMYYDTYNDIGIKPINRLSANYSF